MDMSFDLNKTLEVMLDIEKMANLSRILLEDEVVDKGKISDLTAEDLGIIELMGKHWSSFSVAPLTRTFTAEDPVVELPINLEELIHSWDLDLLTLSEDDRLKTVLHITFDCRIGRNATRPFTDIDTFRRFLVVVSAGYSNVPYHNYVHCYDVLHG